MFKTVPEIIAADLAKNYPDLSMDAETYYANVMRSIEQGEVKLYQKFDTLFIVHDNEWHSIHGGSGIELLDACTAFLQQLKDEGATYMFTCYDNPKISLIAEHSKIFKATVTKINEGKYRTFRLSVEL
jgi:hypothetical protein